MVNVSPKFIGEIFYSGQFGFVGDIEIATKIAFLVNNNYLLLSPITMATKEFYLSTSSNHSLITSRDEASGGGTTHIALKLLAERYLKNEYNVDCVFERPFAGFIPDVQSLNKDIICECGHTNNPEKIFEYFKHPEIRYVIQIPYPNEDDTFVTGYEFQAQPQLNSFLELESSERNQRIKDTINRR